MSEHIRAGFEEWADKQCLSLTRVTWGDGSTSEYAYTATFDAWQAWQAAHHACDCRERELAKIRDAAIELLRHLYGEWSMIHPENGPIGNLRRAIGISVEELREGK